MEQFKPGDYVRSRINNRIYQILKVYDSSYLLGDEDGRVEIAEKTYPKLFEKLSPVEILLRRL